MKKLFLTIVSILVLSAMISSCRNQDVSFPNEAYQTLYFAYQTPIRTIVLGDDDQYDNSSDTAHECEIEATVAGEYSNDHDINISFNVDNSLCNNLYYSLSGKNVVPMPANYYTLEGTSITIPKGNLEGGVKVHLTDAFFNDQASLDTTYVIPLVLVKSDNSKDTIMKGTATVSNPNRVISSDWSTQPKDYILYAVKYINPWDANWLRRGVDAVTDPNGSLATIMRHPTYVEDDEVVRLTTNNLYSDMYPVSDTVVVGGVKQILRANLLLTFDNTGENCTITSNNAGYTATGTGIWIKKGEKNSWGNKDRDGLYLNYAINYSNGYKYATKDTLVLRDRNEELETFSTIYKGN